MEETLIVKGFTFEAAHQLPNHTGKCRDLHGHSYVVEVAITGPINDLRGESSEGMVVDFGWVKDVFQERVHAVCDHQFLNDVLPVPVTTAEHIAGWILGVMRDAVMEATWFAGDVAWVRVHETATSYAEAR